MHFLWRGVVSTSPNPQAGGPPLVGCLRLLIQFIHSYPSILEAIPPSATWGRAMPWWQGPTFMALLTLTHVFHLQIYPLWSMTLPFARQHFQHKSYLFWTSWTMKNERASYSKHQGQYPNLHGINIPVNLNLHHYRCKNFKFHNLYLLRHRDCCLHFT
jgi:hypothetical protein